VRLGVRKSLELPVDSEVKLQSSGVMGERYVDIIRGKSTTVIAPGDTINGEFMMGLSELMGDAGKVMVEVARTTRDLDEILKTLSQNGRLQSSIRDLSEASSDLRSITAENRPKLTKAIAGIEQVSVRLDSLISSHYAALDSSLAGFGRAGQGVDQMVQNLSDASEDLNEIMQKLRGGQGTLGKLLSDDELFDRLNSTVSALDSLITDIKLHPGRYVKLELF
jgi:phospholipid/cholesterol/gamma-HCH transport system substrate-binding protein